MGDQAIWQAEGVQKRTAVRGMFAEIAPTYDLLNSLISFRLHHRWRAFAVRKLNLKPGDRALDVCCGTGDFMRPLKKAVGAEGHVFGIDFCLPMLEIAQKKHVPGSVGLGDACQLPIRAGTLNGVSVGWGIRNVPDIDEAHRELCRVLKPGGRFVSLDMAMPRARLVRAASTFTCNRFVPWLGSLFGKTQAYTYLPKSTQRFMTREELKASMEKAGFVDVGFRDLFFGNVCVHWGTKR
ncbi:MAG TPA: bifunctional demethylmenaquinone methyltransferase/2-methoxy-6-polyprenyl-1,4-benzoquinol methylase UbiE [Fimbriimonadaceae bacterium]|nr:bifunctional demethylmenaquinone methyltransferase/2-methoxy-6-polyprenyl-1,4-benzoquinol methylase UbiE [Fimbriimonadaceae bacterium]